MYMEKIEVGEYVRTNKGNIGQVIDIFQGHCVAKYHIEFKGNVKVKRQYLSTNTIVNHNKRISEIIEVGDYVNGHLVVEISKNAYNQKIVITEVDGKDGAIRHYYLERSIKNVVTHEQFESIEYKVEE